MNSNYPPGVTGTEPEIIGCLDCGDTGMIGDDPCDVCGEGVSERAWVSPVQRIIDICQASEYNDARLARAALDEIHAIAQGIQGGDA